MAEGTILAASGPVRCLALGRTGLPQTVGIVRLQSAARPVCRTEPSHHTTASRNARQTSLSGLTDADRSRRLRQTRSVVTMAGIDPIAEVAGIAPVLPSPWQDVLLAVTVAGLAYLWVKAFDLLVSKGILEKKLSRKLVHMTSGPFLVLTWPLFSSAPEARLLAAAIPCVNAIRLLVVGLGFVEDKGLVYSVSREGDRRELLKGPFYYVLVLIGTTLLFWRDNPAGLIVVAMMCGGDGLADIVGRRWGSLKLPFNTSKSWAGSGAMLVGGFLMSAGLLSFFCFLGYLGCYPSNLMWPVVGVVCAVCTLVEALPLNGYVDDNLSVPVVAGVLSMALIPSVAVAAVAARTSLELAAPMVAPVMLGSLPGS